MVSELIKAFFFIFVAEMGDKTQILAMTFATKYKVSQVLTGVLVGSALNHGIAIALGFYLSNVILVDKIQLIAAVLFIGFGLWTLKPEDDERHDSSRKEMGPIITVGVAFFIGELGDKTQLTALTLATDSGYPIVTLAGTVMGMLVTSGLGIFVGSKIGEKIPELGIKIGSGSIFILFGTLKLFNTLPIHMITPLTVTLFLGSLGIMIVLLLRPTLKIRREGKRTAFKEAAATLYVHAHQVKSAVDNICLGENHCGDCKGEGCLIGYVKRTLQKAVDNQDYIVDEDLDELPSYDYKNFDEDKIIYALSLTIKHYLTYGLHQDKNYVLNRTREALEILAFGEKIPFSGSIKTYYRHMKKKNKTMTKKVIDKVEALKREI